MLLDQDRFETDVLGSKEPVLVDFYKDWCPACNTLAPTMARIAGDHLVCKVNAEDHQDLATRYHISAVPTLVVIRGGKEIARLIGLWPERTLREVMDAAKA